MNRNLLAFTVFTCSLPPLSAWAEPSAKLPTSFITADIDQQRRRALNEHWLWQQVEINEYEMKEVAKPGQKQSPLPMTHFLVGGKTTWNGDHGTLLIAVDRDYKPYGGRVFIPDYDSTIRVVGATGVNPKAKMKPFMIVTSASLSLKVLKALRKKKHETIRQRQFKEIMRQIDANVPNMSKRDRQRAIKEVAGVAGIPVPKN